MAAWPVIVGANLLRNGGVIGHATEGVFGLACDPCNTAAVHRIVRVKRRIPGKGFLLIADRFEALAGWLANPGDEVRALLCATSAVTTWIVPAARGVPVWITGGRDTVAVRVTRHPQAAALCRRFGGALLSTSANRSAQRPALSATQARLRLGASIDWVMPGRIGGNRGPSIIRDSRTGVVIRP